MPEVPISQLSLLIVAILLFVIHEAASIAGSFGPTSAKRVLSRGAFWSGVTALMVLIVWHSVASGRWLPLGDNFTALVWLGLMLALFLAYIYSRRPLGAMEWILTPIVVLLLIGAGIFGRVHPHQYVTSTWSAIHLISSFGGAVAFAVAGGSGFMYLLANRRLRSKHVAPGPHLGSLERLEHLTLISVTLGFALLTVGLITGVVKILATNGETSLGQPWWLSPKVLLAFTVWVIYGIVLHSPINPSFRGRKAAMLSVVGFVLMIGTLVAVQFMPGEALMRRLLLLGLNHTSAPLEIREKIAFSAAQQREALEKFRAAFPESEVVVLSTCNRVEIYTARATHGHPRSEEMSEFLAGFHGVAMEQLRPHLYHKAEREVVDHLFSVASSLDSMVLGETQILGQVREAYDAARESAATGAMLNPLFQRAIAVGKQVMHETALGEGRLSVASVAVDYAKQIFDHFNDKTVLSIGAGKMATLALRHFSALNPKRLLVCNRDPAKSRLLAEEFKGENVAFENLPEHLVAADVVITSTGSREPIILKKQFEGLLKKRRYRPLFMIDIALPRDVERGVGELENVYLYNLDDLQQVVSQTQSQRKDSLEAARKIVAGQVDEFVVAHRARELGPVIEKLQHRYHAMAREELQRTLGKFPNLSEADKAQFEELTRRIVNKLLHAPIQAMRKSDSHTAEGPYLHAMEKLFRLEEESGSEGE